MIRPRGLGMGPPERSPEDIEREAAAELRKALAGSGPRNSVPGVNFAAPGVRDGTSESDRSDGLTPDDERRAITDLAMQQLTDRPNSSIRPADTIALPGGGLSPEDMRNRALADMLDKQRRLARDRPMPPPPANREAPPTGQRTSGVTIAPRLTVAPTLTGSRPPLPGEAAVRGNGPVPAEFLSPPASGSSPSPVRASHEMGRRQPAPRESDEESRWRMLAELADLLAEEPFPADALPEVARWLARGVGGAAAVILLADDAVDVVAASPQRHPLAEGLAASVNRPIDQRSTIWEAVAESRLVAGHAGQAIVMPDGKKEPELGTWVVAPVADRTLVFGAIVVAQDRGQESSADVETLVADVGRRIGRALRNCEEVANSAGADDRGLPSVVRDGLGALAVVLGAVEELPAPALDADGNREYRLIAGRAAELRSQIGRFLAGRPGGER